VPVIELSIQTILRSICLRSYCLFKRFLVQSVRDESVSSKNSTFNLSVYELSIQSASDRTVYSNDSTFNLSGIDLSIKSVSDRTVYLKDSTLKLSVIDLSLQTIHRSFCQCSFYLFERFLVHSISDRSFLAILRLICPFIVSIVKFLLKM